MKQRVSHNNNEQLYYARIRSHHYGESQSFTSSDAAIQWVEQTSRELVASGYTNVTFTIQGEYNRNNCKRQATSNQYSNSKEAELITRDSKIDSFNFKEKKENMESKTNKTATDFFSLSESEVRTIAAATMDAATHGKELNDREFVDAIADASNGLVSLHRSVKNANRVDFREWDAYTATHAPRDPGKKPLEAIEQTIIDTYRRGRSGTSVKRDSNAMSSYTSSNNVLSSSSQNNSPAGVLIQNIISTILVHQSQDDMVRHYLRCYSAGLEAELSYLTGDVLACSVSDDIVTLTSGTGVTTSVLIEGRSMTDIANELFHILSRMMLEAAIMPQTRDTIAGIIDASALTELIYSL